MPKRPATRTADQNHLPDTTAYRDAGEHPCQRCGRPVVGTLRPDGTPWPFCATCLAAVQRAATPAQPATITLPQLDQAFRTLTALGTFLPAAQEQASAPPFTVALVGYARLHGEERPVVVRLDDPSALAFLTAMEAGHPEAAAAAPWTQEHGIACWVVLRLQSTDAGKYRQQTWALLAGVGINLKLPERVGAWADLWHPLPARNTTALARHPGPFRDGQTSILSAKPFLAARDAMLAATEREMWAAVNEIVVYRVPDPKSGGYVDVQRRCDASTPDGMLAELARASNDLLADTFAAITARYIAAGAPTDGIWVNVDDVLRDRGLTPITRPGDRYSHGYRTEDRLAIGEHLAELERWAITGRLQTWQGKRSTRQQPILIDSALLATTDHVYQITTEGRKMPLAVRCGLGEYARHFLANGAGRQTALLMQAALRYDPKNEQIQKRLAYHLAFRWRLAAHDRDYAQPVRLGTLFAEAHIPTDGPTQRQHPARTVAGWVKALDTLKHDGLLADYELLPGTDERRRSMVDRWLAQRVRLIPPAHIPEHYQAIGTSNPRLRQ